MEPRCRDIRGSSALIQHVSETEIAEPIMHGACQLPDRAKLADSSPFLPALPWLVANEAVIGYFPGSRHQNGVRLRIAAASVPSSR